MISIEKTEGYKLRSELSSKDASLILRDVRVEDSGMYRITVLALDVISSAQINLIVTEGKRNTTYLTLWSSLALISLFKFLFQ